MVNHESFTIIGLVVQSLLGSCCSIWGLEANKSKSISSFSFLESDLLNVAELVKQTFELIFGPVGREVLDIEITSLLRSFVSESVFLLLDISISSLHGVSHIEFHVGVSTHVSTIESINGFLCAFWPVFFVGVVWIIVTNKTKLTNVVLLNNQ